MGNGPTPGDGSTPDRTRINPIQGSPTWRPSAVKRALRPGMWRNKFGTPCRKFQVAAVLAQSTGLTESCARYRAGALPIAQRAVQLWRRSRPPTLRRLQVAGFRPQPKARRPFRVGLFVNRGWQLKIEKLPVLTLPRRRPTTRSSVLASSGLSAHCALNSAPTAHPRSLPRPFRACAVRRTAYAFRTQPPATS